MLLGASLPVSGVARGRKWPNSRRHSACRRPGRVSALHSKNSPRRAVSHLPGGKGAQGTGERRDGSPTRSAPDGFPHKYGAKDGPVHSPKAVAGRFEGPLENSNAWAPRILNALSALRERVSNPFDKEILTLALPTVLALAADPLLSMVDTAFTGRLGPDELGALGVNTALYSFAFVVFNFLATATTPLLASALAAGDKPRAGQVVWQALLLSAFLGFGLLGAIEVYGDAALASMGAGPESGDVLHSAAQDYLYARALAAPAVMVVMVGQGTFRGLRDTKTQLWITLGANLVNAALDPVLMFQLGWGVKGAAAATTISECVAAACYLNAMRRRAGDLGLSRASAASLFGDGRAALRRMKPFASAAGAVALRTGSLMASKTLAGASAAHYGASAIAAHQVLMQVWSLSSLILDSLAVSGQTIVAVKLGTGKHEEAGAVAKRLLTLGVGLGLVLATVFCVMPDFAAIFTSDAEVADAVHGLFPIVVAMLPINSLVYVLDGILVGGSDFGFLASAMAASSAVTIGLLQAVEPMEGSGLHTVWGCMCALMLARLSTLAYRYASPDSPLRPKPAVQPVEAEAILVEAHDVPSTSESPRPDIHDSSSPSPSSRHVGGADLASPATQDRRSRTPLPPSSSPSTRNAVVAENGGGNGVKGIGVHGVGGDGDGTNADDGDGANAGGDRTRAALELADCASSSAASSSAGSGPEPSGGGAEGSGGHSWERSRAAAPSGPGLAARLAGSRHRESGAAGSSGAATDAGVGFADADSIDDSMGSLDGDSIDAVVEVVSDDDLDATDESCIVSERLMASRDG